MVFDDLKSAAVWAQRDMMVCDDDDEDVDDEGNKSFAENVIKFTS